MNQLTVSQTLGGGVDNYVPYGVRDNEIREHLMLQYIIKSTSFSQCSILCALRFRLSGVAFRYENTNSVTQIPSQRSIITSVECIRDLVFRK